MKVNELKKLLLSLSDKHDLKNKHSIVFFMIPNTERPSFLPDFDISSDILYLYNTNIRSNLHTKTPPKYWNVFDDNCVVRYVKHQESFIQLFVSFFFNNMNSLKKKLFCGVISWVSYEPNMSIYFLLFMKEHHVVYVENKRTLAVFSAEKSKFWAAQTNNPQRTLAPLGYCYFQLATLACQNILAGYSNVSWKILYLRYFSYEHWWIALIFVKIGL